MLGSGVNDGVDREGEEAMGIDLNQELVRHRQATVLLRVSGDSMQGAGIRSGDWLLVDRALAAHHGHIVVALLADGFTLKRLVQRGENWLLVAANPAYRDLPLTGRDDARLWGVATQRIHSF
ncbi:S24 family peptidase [Cyanobium sp. WAJ14-Wanaka]|uniref:LexA family protein n=1 Tax=Cyanobium sp. WAJ14-Wanaka TaxID=2823725 RepID=UPI0020CC8AB7|nr:S24 family peptidase [Cyanobium sp. WAJ14-Wanaka]